MSRARYTWETKTETRELLTRVKEITGAPSLGETLRQALEHYAEVVGVGGDCETISFHVSPRSRRLLDIIGKRWDADSPEEVIRRSLGAVDVLTGVEERGERVVVIRSDGGMDRFMTP